MDSNKSTEGERFVFRLDARGPKLSDERRGKLADVEIV
jgi:hypothetical protein